MHAQCSGRQSGGGSMWRKESRARAVRKQRVSECQIHTRCDRMKQPREKENLSGSGVVNVELLYGRFQACGRMPNHYRQHSRLCLLNQRWHVNQSLIQLSLHFVSRQHTWPAQRIHWHFKSERACEVTVQQSLFTYSDRQSEDNTRVPQV